MFLFQFLDEKLRIFKNYKNFKSLYNRYSIFRLCMVQNKIVWHYIINQWSSWKCLKTQKSICHYKVIPPFDYTADMSSNPSINGWSENNLTHKMDLWIVRLIWNMSLEKICQDIKCKSIYIYTVLSSLNFFILFFLFYTI